jgi:hypothetical protein
MSALLLDPTDDGGLPPGDNADGLNPESLVQLVQDLNQCNDALLLRVSELEEALERSQVALQAEIERHQASPTGLPMELTPGPVQQQIAQLLSELDIANDGLRRTTIHNETLQAELDASQQRVAQLERECTLLQQRFSEKNTALHQAEETCRDLKARLHRQQRYTLQFKAALDKCLNMAPGSASTGLAGPARSLETAAETVGSPLTMPRSQQILPWSSGNDAKADPPSLTNLLRGLRGSSSPTASPTASHPFQSEPPQPEPPQSKFLQPDPLQPDPLQPELPKSLGAMPEAVVSPSPTPPSPDPWLEQMPEPEPIAPATAATPLPLFTEPSPWGEPIEPAPAAPRAAAPEPPPAAPVAPAAPTAGVPAAPSLPDYLNSGGKPSPSPLVYPLRSQKKIKSIAAVELPSFGRTVRRR